MSPTLVVLAVIAVLLAGAWYVDFLGRRRRRGLSSLSGPTSPGDPIANAERIRPGVSIEATRDHFGDHGTSL